MNKGSPVGRIMTLDEAIQFWERCIEAEKIMGKLGPDEKLAILKTIGKEVTLEELADLCNGKKTLVIKSSKENNDATEER